MDRQVKFPAELKQSQNAVLGQLIGQAGMGHDPQQTVRNAPAIMSPCGLFGVRMQLIVIPGQACKIDDISLRQGAGFGNKFLSNMKIIEIQ